MDIDVIDSKSTGKIDGISAAGTGKRMRDRLPFRGLEGPSRNAHETQVLSTLLEMRDRLPAESTPTAATVPATTGAAAGAPTAVPTTATTVWHTTGDGTGATAITAWLTDGDGTAWLTDIGSHGNTPALPALPATLGDEATRRAWCDTDRIAESGGTSPRTNLTATTCEIALGTTSSTGLLDHCGQQSHRSAIAVPSGQPTRRGGRGPRGSTGGSEGPVGQGPLSCDIAGRTDWRQEAESATWDGFLRLGLDTFSPGPLHFTTRAALQLVSWGRVCCMERLYIYTDGSGGDGAGWAFTVIGELGGDFFICGVAGHTLQGSASASLAVALDSTNAELMAIIWAGLFALTVPDHIGICLCPDSTYAIAAANLELRLASTRVLEHIVGAIITTARQTRRVHTQHVKAHWDAPWNELADCLAKHCRSSSLSVLPANLRGKICDNAGL